MITQERLKQLLHYDPETGVFTRRIRTSNRIKSGDVAGCLTPYGYRSISVDNAKYQAHRLAWLYMTGAWPIAGIDHRNGLRDDNRWSNLREATHAENAQNIAIPGHNKSGFVGVSWYRPSSKWMACIMVAGRTKYLGYFTTPENAHAAYLAAKSAHHTFQPTLRS